MFNLKGRVAVITGASSGLGRQMATGFAKQGADLVLLARRIERLEDLKRELEPLGVKVLPIKCDVTNSAEVDAAASVTELTFGKVDILLNCAGASRDKGALDMNDEEWNFTINTDLTSVFKVTRAFGNIMKKNNYGRIINIASMYGLVGNDKIPTIAYHSSKGGVVNVQDIFIPNLLLMFCKQKIFKHLQKNMYLCKDMVWKGNLMLELFS